MSGEGWGEDGGVEIEVTVVKLFAKWDPDEVQVSDISLTVSIEFIEISLRCIVWVYSIVPLHDDHNHQITQHAFCIVFSSDNVNVHYIQSLIFIRGGA